MLRSIVLVVLTAVSAGALAIDFRVTAVFGTAREGLMAIVETSAGAHRTVRKGDEVGGLRILEVVPEGLRVDMEGKPTLIGLREGPRSPDGSGSGVPAKDLAGRLRGLPMGPSGRSVQGLDELIGLDMGAEVITIEDQPVASLEAALASIQAGIRGHGVARLGVRGDPERTVIYLGSGMSEPGVPPPGPVTAPEVLTGEAPSPAD